MAFCEGFLRRTNFCFDRLLYALTNFDSSGCILEGKVNKKYLILGGKIVKKSKCVKF